MDLQSLRERFVRVNRIYIMPSGRGALFLTAVVVMILTAASYNNNLIFILAFFLFAIFVVSMLQTHYNLKSVRAEYVGADEVFEGDQLPLTFHLSQKRARLKRDLELRASSKLFPTLKAAKDTLRVDETTRSVQLQVRATRRGVHGVPEIILETFYPLGLFRAWKVFRFKGSITVYPKADGADALSLAADAAGEDESGLRTSPEGDFGELKPYQVGESYRQIAWKHFARTNQLFTKAHWGAEQRHYVLRWDATKDLETHLRQMSRWVLTAVEEDASFELETPRRQIEAGRGREHARACWRALAHVTAGGGGRP